MARQEIHSTDVKIDQAPIITDQRMPEIVKADESVLTDKEYVDNIKFFEEPVTILIHPSTEKNAPTRIPVWVNGAGAEVLTQAGRWQRITFLPVDTVITVKRKVLSVLLGSKVDSIETVIEGRESDHPINRIKRRTTAMNGVSVIQDGNPKGSDWVRGRMRSRY